MCVCVCVSHRRTHTLMCTRACMCTAGRYSVFACRGALTPSGSVQEADRSFIGLPGPAAAAACCVLISHRAAENLSVFKLRVQVTAQLALCLQRAAKKHLISPSGLEKEKAASFEVHPNVQPGWGLSSVTSQGDDSWNRVSDHQKVERAEQKKK